MPAKAKRSPTSPPNRRKIEELIALHQARQALDLGKLPETDDINKLVDAGVSTRTITEWLRNDCGYGSRTSWERVKAYAAKRRGSAH